MAASSPGDPRALSCRYCGAQRRFVRRTLVCATCDDTPRWPGGALEPGRGDAGEPGRDAGRGTPPSQPGAPPPGARGEEDGRGSGQAR